MMNEQTIQYHLENIRDGRYVVSHIKALDNEIAEIRLELLAKNISPKIRALLSDKARRIEKDLGVSAKYFINETDRHFVNA